MSEVSNDFQGVIASQNAMQYPVNGQSLLQFIGAIDSPDNTEDLCLVLHEEHAPIQLTRRQIQVALLESDSLTEIHARIDGAAKHIAHGVDVNTTAGAKLIRTLAKNVRSAKSMVNNIADTVKKQVDAAIELPTSAKKSIISNIKMFADSVDGTWETVRAPLTAIEEQEKARKAEIERILAELEEMMVTFDKDVGDFYPSEVFTRRIERLPTIIPENLKDEPKLIAKLQDVEKVLPDYMASAKLHEKQKLELEASKEAQKKAELKAEVQGDLLKDAVKVGADIGKQQQVQSSIEQAAVIEKVAEIAPKVLEPVQEPTKPLTLEQKQAMAAAWDKVRMQNGITSDEGKAAFELIVRLLIKGMFPYATVAWSE